LNHLCSRKLHKLKEEEFANFILKDTELPPSQRKATSLYREIAKKLTGRDALSVSRHVVKHYARERYPQEWTSQNDATLRKLVAEHGKQWPVVAAAMGRSPEIVRLRYRDYASLRERKAGRWEESENLRLYEIVIKLLHASQWNSDEGLDVEVVSKHIDWGIVSRKMGNRSRLQCRAKWVQVDKWQDLAYSSKLKDRV
jgi:hypothetical protein